VVDPEPAHRADAGESDEMVLLPDIRFVSHCEHHIGADVGRAQFDHESAKKLVEPKPGWRFFTK
jgi:GTP cyclohydrolase I